MQCRHLEGGRCQAERVELAACHPTATVFQQALWLARVNSRETAHARYVCSTHSLYGDCEEQHCCIVIVQQRSCGFHNMGVTAVA